MNANDIVVSDVPESERHTANTTRCTGFVVPRRGLRPGKFVETAVTPLAPGETLLRIDRFAFSASNLAYAALGERKAYWRIFPAAEPGGGVIPVWGFADVIASRHGRIREGERIFGLFPMASHLVVRPMQVEADRFVDGIARRSRLPAAYNLYRRAASDAAYNPVFEDLQSLLRPSFASAFLLDDYLSSLACFGAEAVLLSSAASRPACGLAHRLHSRAKSRYGIEVIGLTATGCQQAAERLGCYDYVVSYDAIGSLPPDQPTVFVDLSGSSVIRSAVHGQYGETLKASLVVDLAGCDPTPLSRATPGRSPILLRTRAHYERRLGEWGRDAFELRFAEAWLDYAGFAEHWITLRHGRGRAAVQAAYAAMLDGQAKPDEGHILSLRN